MTQTNKGLFLIKTRRGHHCHLTDSFSQHISKFWMRSCIVYTVSAIAEVYYTGCVGEFLLYSTYLLAITAYLTLTKPCETGANHVTPVCGIQAKQRSTRNAALLAGEHAFWSRLLFEKLTWGESSTVLLMNTFIFTQLYQENYRKSTNTSTTSLLSATLQHFWTLSF